MRVYNDEFWDGLDFVTNAVDSVYARLYIESMCVWHEKHLLESGTLGSKAPNYNIKFSEYKARIPQ